MKKEEILTMINENPVCHIATTEGTQPRVRGILIYRADTSGIIFHTGAFKDMYKQILENPFVELCFYAPATNTQIRIMGVAEAIDDQSLKSEIVEARDFLKAWIEQGTLDDFIVFHVKKCKATLWTMETNFAQKKYIEF